jgi:hypothetical protein
MRPRPLGAAVTSSRLEGASRSGISVIIRFGAFLLLAFVAQCVPALRRPLVVVALVAVAIAWFIVLTNISALATG